MYKLILRGFVPSWLIYVAWTAAPASAVARPHTLHFVFTSDAHYGLRRASFRHAADVDASVVNRALVARVNELPATRFPADGGIDAGEPIGAIDFVAEGGDIANRSEVTEAGAIQSARASWAQFESDYVNGLRTHDAAGRPSALYIVPGNHEASNAVGFFSPMIPATDTTAIVEIFNRMMHPAVAKTTATFDYASDRVMYTKDHGGVHFIYAQIWLDSKARAWVDHDLAVLPASTPVVLVVHDQPEADARHFINPNGTHDINKTDGFENLLADQFADGPAPNVPTVSEQRDLERYLARHPNIVAWFHGNSNWNEFYTWRGPGHSATLKVFRVDSPMKGKASATDERQLSFHVAAIDPATQTMTVRECLWNADPDHPAWGASVTVSLKPAAAQ